MIVGWEDQEKNDEKKQWEDRTKRYQIGSWDRQNMIVKWEKSEMEGRKEDRKSMKIFFLELYTLH